MIPRHRPPFGLGPVVRSVLGNGRRPRIDEIEESFSQKLGVAHAIWLPSVRAGILWTLRAIAGPDTRVIGPAFTCKRVHEAIASSGLAWQLVDAAPNGFLMNRESLGSAQQGTTCTVFCEVFGHVYDFSDQSRSMAKSEQTSRILDMAGTIPNRALLARLAGNDVALVSFNGAGKCMTAGWGGIGFTRDSGLAAELRSLRDSSLRRETGRLRFTRCAKVLAQMALYGGPFYAAARRFRHRPVAPEGPVGRLPGQFGVGLDTTSGGYWHLPSTVVDRRLSQHNLMRAGDYEGKHLSDAVRYRDNLGGVAGICLPPFSDNALSHFTIRVSAHGRSEIRRCLWQAGVDVGTYYPFPPFLSRHEYPNAHRLSSEVLNLPLGPGFDDHDIDRISEVLIRCAGNQRHEAPVDQSSDLIRQAPPATVSYQ
ncbi:MAG: DegT/DnrJ/EryC1/StrS family aminotransferase [Candidatus Dormibacteraeota bacterium]|nr:DegT/DnrJ/EryC1/StrS family aminotransferase [Candidatus Dormibacteraeota bacterium]